MRVWSVVSVCAGLLVWVACGGESKSVKDKLPDSLKEPPPLEASSGAKRATSKGSMSYWSACPRAQRTPQDVRVNCRDFFLRVEHPREVGEDSTQQTLARHVEAMRGEASSMKTQPKPLKVGGREHPAVRYTVQARRGTTYGVLVVVSTAKGQRAVQCAVKGAVGVEHCERIVRQVLTTGLPSHVEPGVEASTSAVVPMFAGKSLVLSKGCTHPSRDRIRCDDGTVVMWSERPAASAPGEEATRMAALERGMRGRFARVKTRDVACTIQTERAQACRALSLLSGPGGDGFVWLARGVVRNARVVVMCAYPSARGRRIPTVCRQLVRSPDKLP